MQEVEGNFRTASGMSFQVLGAKRSRVGWRLVHKKLCHKVLRRQNLSVSSSPGTRLIGRLMLHNVAGRNSRMCTWASNPAELGMLEVASAENLCSTTASRCHQVPKRPLPTPSRSIKALLQSKPSSLQWPTQRFWEKACTSSPISSNAASASAQRADEGNSESTLAGSLRLRIGRERSWPWNEMRDKNIILITLGPGLVKLSAARSQSQLRTCPSNGKAFAQAVQPVRNHVNSLAT